jgi:subtilisin family serine protease
MKTLTVILDKDQQGKIEQKVTRILEHYDSFALVEATDEQLSALKQEGFKVIESDEPSAIKLGAFMINTDEPRYSEKGDILAHPSYAHTIDPGPGRHHYIVRFIGPIKESWKEQIKTLNGFFGDPLPSHSYIVEMDGKTRDQVAGLPFVSWIGHYDPTYRLSHNLLGESAESEQMRAQPPGTEKAEPLKKQQDQGSQVNFKKAVQVPNTFLVTFHTPQNLQEALPGIRSLGANPGQINQNDPNVRTITVSFPADTTQIADKLNQLASIHGVLTIDALRVKQLRNNIATRIMTDSLDAQELNLPLTGEGEIIAIADTGIDTGNPDTIHEDFRGRIAGIRSWPINPAFGDFVKNPGADDGPADLDSGHGTHVAGSVLGEGKKAQDFGKQAVRGLSYRASLFFQAVEQKMDWKPEYEYKRGIYGTYVLTGLPDDLTTLFQQAYDAGTRIHSNSWGGGDFGTYDLESRDVDRFVWEHKDMIILFAAGNDGEDRNRDGKVDLGSITPPSTAKNSIAVGASENQRKNVSDTYKMIGPLQFPTAPIASDRIADNPDDIAAFSSRGPCLDARFKPDVVAPGTRIFSTKPVNNPENELTRYEDFYMYMDGTSMATPLTAGAVGLIREYLRKTIQTIPTAALVKATLIHTAVRRPYRYTSLESDSELWDPEQGWGHVNLRPFISAIPGWSIKFVDIKQGLETGQSWKFNFDVHNSNHPVKVSLVWSDYPAVADKYPSLINNLDLIVTAPNGQDYHGNVFIPPYDSKLDAINNVESVLITDTQPGQYKVTVLASEVAAGPQDFALVYSGGL